jgi:hypothetical protein
MKRLLFSIFVIVILVGCSSKPVVIEDPNTDDPIDDEKPINNEEPVDRSTFNGQEFDGELYEAFAIMIENTAAARPQSGLSLADIVYEITVEGWDITRMVAIFSNNHPTKVGPVRSARLPFVHLMNEWILPFAHFGTAATGQGDAITLLKSINLPIRFDGHKGLNDEFYSRDTSRVAPHNAYFNAAMAKVKIPELQYVERFKFDNISNVDDEDIPVIKLKYSTINRVKYIFDPIIEKYFRFVNDEPHLDAYNGEQIAVTNVIILYAPHRSVEKVEYILVDFVGEGIADFFINGKRETGTWEKLSEQSITKFYDSLGEEIILLPGNTWIQVVHNKVLIEVEQIDK